MHSQAAKKITSAISIINIQIWLIHKLQHLLDLIPDFLPPTFKTLTRNTANQISWLELLQLVSNRLIAGCDLPAARVPCGWGCSRAAPAAGGYIRSVGQRGTMPGETGGLALGSWRGALGPKLNTSAAAAGWPGGGPGLLPPLCHALTHKQKHINTALHFKIQGSKDIGEKGYTFQPKTYWPAAACWCCGCWTGLAAGWLGGPPCCGGPPCWPWPVGVAEGWGCCGWGCKVALGWGYCCGIGPGDTETDGMNQKQESD